MWFSSKIDPEKVKKKNSKKLKSMGVEVIDHLPVLDDAKFRGAEEIAKRMMALIALFQLHLEAPNDFVRDWLKENGLLECLTEKESYYLETSYSELPEQDQTDIYWYIEAVWAFAWVGGLHDSLTLNTWVEDSLVNLIPNVQKKETAKRFIKKFELRSKKEIFEKLDILYRAHWFARNNHLKGIDSKIVDLDLVMERRKALEFSVYNNVAWNDISLDT